jgi:hypothetical protein
MISKVKLPVRLRGDILRYGALTWLILSLAWLGGCAHSGSITAAELTPTAAVTPISTLSLLSVTATAPPTPAHCHPYPAFADWLAADAHSHLSGDALADLRTNA